MIITYRSLQASDEPFLWEMLYLALFPPPGQPPFPRSILTEPDIACYVKDWGRQGDWGLLALDGEIPIGACWLRQWLESRKGFGYVRDDIPEVSIALLPAYRNMHLGTEMLTSVLAAARERGFPGISLSVVEISPAKRLYERLGFVKVGQVDDSPVMLYEFTAGDKNGY